MHVVVIGAGVIGVTTAHYLHTAGHQVTLIDRRDNAAQESSFANAGLIAPGHVAPWAAPGMPGQMLRALFRSTAPIRLRPGFDAALWRWTRAWLRECAFERYRANRERMQRLAVYSREQLQELRELIGLEYDQHHGHLQLLRTPRDVAAARPGLELLAQAGIAHELVDPDRCYALEPGLARDTPLSAGIWFANDESGNCALFTRRLKSRLAGAGVALRLGEAVTGLAFDPAPRVHLADGSALGCDAVVVCAGVDSAALLAPLGVHLPLVAVKGHSITMPVKSFERAPQGALIDAHHRVAITRLGLRMRVSGGAELSGRALAVRPQALNTLWRVVRDWFGPAPDYTCPQLWVGARPMLPEGLPLLGASTQRGLYLNLGHGSNGWAMACGSGKIVADLIDGRAPDMDLSGFTLADRYPR